MSYLLAFILAMGISIALIPLIIHWARKRNIFDAHDERKIHSGNIPRLGGLAIYLGFLVGFCIAAFIIGRLYPSFAIPSVFWIIFGAGFGFHVLGLVDDLRGGLRARFKFLIQFLLAVVVVAAGYSFRVLELPFAPYRLELGFFGPVITVFWIVGLSNALNLIDGMDGLAGGIAMIGTAVWALFFFKTGQTFPALVTFVLCGAIGGFLFYNFPPASIFMGDSGSLFLGFILAVVPLLGAPTGQAESGLIQAVTICLIPVLDTFAAILRRWRLGVSFFTPDKYHVHHKLLNLGFQPRYILVIIYALCIGLGATVLVSIFVNPQLSFYLMMGGWAFCGCIFIVLHFLKEKKVRFFGKAE
jgi:UDP-GlcNAc:undecaprenyl-phosphate/decaprenyl-phosphate GlcNAc-1-phosphate transferase